MAWKGTLPDAFYSKIYGQSVENSAQATDIVSHRFKRYDFGGLVPLH